MTKVVLCVPAGNGAGLLATVDSNNALHYWAYTWALPREKLIFLIFSNPIGPMVTNEWHRNIKQHIISVCTISLQDEFV